MSMIQIPPYWKPVRRKSRQDRFMALTETCFKIWLFVVVLTIVIGISIITNGVIPKTEPPTLDDQSPSSYLNHDAMALFIERELAKREEALKTRMYDPETGRVVPYNSGWEAFRTIGNLK